MRSPLNSVTYSAAGFPLPRELKALSTKIAGKRLTDSILGLDGKALAKGELYSNFIKAGANDGDMRAFPRNTQLALASNYEAIAAARLAHSSAAAAPSGKFLKEAAAAVDGIDRTYTAAKSALDEAAGAASEQPGAFRPLPNTGDIRPHVDPVGELVHCSKAREHGQAMRARCGVGCGRRRVQGQVPAV